MAKTKMAFLPVTRIDKVKVETNVDNISSKPMKSEYYLFQGEFKNQPETAKEGGEKDEEGGDTFVKAVCFLRV